MKKIMRTLPAVLIILVIQAGFAQDDYVQQIEQYRAERDQVFQNPETSPLPENRSIQPDSLRYYPVDEKYRIDARLTVSDEQPEVLLTTSDGKNASFIKYGEISFMLDGKSYSLDVYKTGDFADLTWQDETLFVPFTDDESGELGRYVPLGIPVGGDQAVIDFNKAVNPYAAYNNSYSSPMAPGNSMGVGLPVGERKYEDR
ncbi:MAG: DUF1684 domain-containing protein [Bacteroidales bacterium]|nr:DUF1684 domain-containing protein [Bacteroidales bacterium]MCF8343496.1 DUF1684 domain-containing protein [Bacteroidales bacterium]MCF8349749.1 DUF1684 domain-containing protein [Bacteroidales bacterium]MCF8376268.1 DUF1684 domain-containing protein [Bacteroidales bacterium]MCF8401563.1 DUF1684 domain-containing protein [Bacteroidales bacterium]